MQNENFFLYENNPVFKQEEVAIFRKKIEQSFHIGIFPHKGADGDAMGSSFGLGMFLSRLGKSWEILCVDEPKYKAPKFSNYRIGNLFNQKPDLLISVDCGSLDRFFIHPSYINLELINIDHHSSNNLFGNLNFVDPSRSSACEVITELLFLAFGKEFFSKEIAEAFLTGMITDTQCLANQPLKKEFFRCLNFLIECEANFFKIKNIAIPKMTIKEFQPWQKAFSIGQSLCEENLFLIKIDQSFLLDNDFKPEFFDGFVNFIGLQFQVEFSVVLVEFEPKKVKGSLRSKQLSAQKIAKLFGGGGHDKASGFILDGNANIIEIAKKIELEANAQLKN